MEYYENPNMTNLFWDNAVLYGTLWSVNGIVIWMSLITPQIVFRRNSIGIPLGGWSSKALYIPAILR